MSQGEKELNKPKRRRGVAVLGGVAVLLLLATLGALLPQFYIEKITVEGTKATDQNALVESSGIRLGDHLFSQISGDFLSIVSLRYGNVEKQLQRSFPSLETVEVKAEFPSTVRVHVTERKKIAYIQLPDAYAIIDTQGYVIQLIGGRVEEGRPAILGLPVEAAVLGQPVALTEQQGFNNALLLLNAILAADNSNAGSKDFSLMACVKSLRPVAGGPLFLSLRLPEREKELLVKVGSLRNITADMEWLRFAASQGHFQDTGEGILDMSGEEYTFKPKG